MKKLLLIMATVLLGITAVRADMYAELSVEGGGEEIIASNFGDSIDIGGGVKLAIGIQNPLTADHAAALRLTVGYLFDRIEASNGDADFDALTFDALYLVGTGPHTLGVGATFHMSPRYADDIVGLAPLEIAFDDAVGLVFQYGYQLMSGLEVGIKLTDIDYRTGNLRYDAGSFGVYISNGF